MMTGNTAFIPLYIKLDNFNVCIFGFGEVGQRRFNKVLKGAPKKITIYDKQCNTINLNNTKDNKNINFIQRDIKNISNEELEQIIKNYDIIITAIDEKNNKRIVDISKNLNKLINSSTFENDINIIIPACYENNGVYFSIYTKGKSPLIAKEIRKIVENYLKNNDIFIMQQIRDILKDKDDKDNITLKSQKDRKKIFEKLLKNEDFKKEFKELIDKYAE